VRVALLLHKRKPKHDGMVEVVGNC
jgi:hypothetical protein